ncbi:MFS transporter [Bacillus subtilis]|nr:MFS transporter [Bacillus subtilis]
MRRRDELAALLALAATGWGANQFAPLVVMYQEVSDVDVVAAQTMFVLYAVGLVPGLFIGGPLSDRHGRRIVVTCSLVVSGLSTVLLMLGAASTSWLYIGRLLAGVSSGAGFSAGTAWVKEVASGTSGARHAVIAMTSGFALGPLVAGLLSAAVPHPQVIVYAPHLVITAVAVGLVARGKRAETNATHARGRPIAGHPSTQRSLPRDPRFVWIVMPLAPWVFLTASTALAVLPGAIPMSGGDNRALIFSALVTPIPAVAGILVQSLTRRFAEHMRAQITVGFAFAVAGFAVGAWAVAITSLPGIVSAAVLLGCAYGACQTVGLSEVAQISPPERLGQNTAVYQALTYVGYLAPLPIVMMTRWWSLPTILIALAVMAAATAALIWTHARKASA